MPSDTTRTLLDHAIAALDEPDTQRPDIAFRSDREARAAISAWLLDGAEIIRRCRVEGMDEAACREQIACVAMTAILHFDRYRGVCVDPLERDALRRWIEREIAGDPDAICAMPNSEGDAA